jgi:hypothetical protein
MLRDVIRTLIAQDPELELVGGVEVPDLRTAVAVGADVVVFGDGEVTDRQAEALLRRSCRMRLVGIANDGASATVFEMRPHREWLGELDARPFLAVLRGSTDGS